MKKALATILGGGLAEPVINKLLDVDQPTDVPTMEDEKEKRRRMMGQRGIGGRGMGQRGMMGPRPGMKKGGKVKSASKRGDGCARQGKTKGRMV